VTLSEIFGDKSERVNSRINDFIQNGSEASEPDESDSDPDPDPSDTDGENHSESTQDTLDDKEESTSGEPSREEKLRITLNEHNVDSLKNKLRERDLKVSGTKDELIDRLVKDELEDSEKSANSTPSEPDTSDESPDEPSQTAENEDDDGDSVSMNDFLAVCQPWLGEFINISQMKSTIEVYGKSQTVLDSLKQYLEDVEADKAELRIGPNNELAIDDYLSTTGGQ